MKEIRFYETISFIFCGFAKSHLHKIRDLQKPLTWPQSRDSKLTGLIEIQNAIYSSSRVYWTPRTGRFCSIRDLIDVFFSHLHFWCWLYLNWIICLGLCCVCTTMLINHSSNFYRTKVKSLCIEENGRCVKKRVLSCCVRTEVYLFTSVDRKCDREPCQTWFPLAQSFWRLDARKRYYMIIEKHGNWL